MKYLLILLLAISGKAIAQVNNVDANLLQSFKLYVAIDRASGIIDLKDVINSNDKIDVLGAKGFDKLMFLGMQTDKLGDIAGKTSIKDNKTAFSCYYVIAYRKDQNKIYLLKGFRKNDFRDFYAYEIPNNFKKKSGIYGKIADLAAFNTDFHIDNIDMFCLYDEKILLKRTAANCSCSCEERDASYAVQH